MSKIREVDSKWCRFKSFKWQTLPLRLALHQTFFFLMHDHMRFQTAFTTYSTQIYTYFLNYKQTLKGTSIPSTPNYRNYTVVPATLIVLFLCSDRIIVTLQTHRGTPNQIKHSMQPIGTYWSSSNQKHCRISSLSAVFLFAVWISSTTIISASTVPLVSQSSTTFSF